MDVKTVTELLFLVLFLSSALLGILSGIIFSLKLRYGFVKADADRFREIQTWGILDDEYVVTRKVDLKLGAITYCGDQLIDLTDSKINSKTIQT